MAMGLFSRKDSDGGRPSRSNFFPREFESELASWGQFSLNPTAYSGAVWFPIINSYEFMQLRQQNHDRFIEEVAALPVEGWATYGAFKLLSECGYINDVPSNPSATQVFRAGLEYMRATQPNWNRYLVMDEVAALNRLNEVS
jgi:hypothetical protein